MDVRIQDLLAVAEDALHAGVAPERVAAALRQARVPGDIGTAIDRLDQMRWEVAHR